MIHNGFVQCSKKLSQCFLKDFKDQYKVEIEYERYISYISIKNVFLKYDLITHTYTHTVHIQLHIFIV